MKPTEINLSDLSLFGNDVAEDERDEVFQSYVLEREDATSFLDETQQLVIARAFKGEGKSALLRLTKDRVQSANPDYVVISRSATSIGPEPGTEDFSAYVRKWKAALLNEIALELGSRINVAWSDDAMSLVEEAEKRGFRHRGVVSTITDRLKVHGEVLGAKLPSIDISKPGLPADPEALVQRWLSGRTPTWLIIDDLDKNFEPTRHLKLKVAAFFDACRELNRAIPELRIRASVRPTVWSSVKPDFESLSHVEQYMRDLIWSEDNIRELLAKRVEGYLKRTKQWDFVSRDLNDWQPEAEKQLIELAFEENMRWGGKTRPPHVLFDTLSKHRPRWVVELAKGASKRATAAGHERISYSDIIEGLGTFGRLRIDDTVAEFGAQCPEIRELIDAFNRAPEELTTSELFSIIDRKILNHLQPRITGAIGEARARDVAAFLFQIGFFYGRRDKANGDYEHIGYSDNPSQFQSRSDTDAGLTWEIHPVFRQALEIRDKEGLERRQRSTHRAR